MLPQEPNVLAIVHACFQACLVVVISFLSINALCRAVLFGDLLRDTNPELPDWPEPMVRGRDVPPRMEPGRLLRQRTRVLIGWITWRQRRLNTNTVQTRLYAVRQGIGHRMSDTSVKRHLGRQEARKRPQQPNEP
jgi:hypothetical protein